MQPKGALHAFAARIAFKHYVVRRLSLAVGERDARAILLESFRHVCTQRLLGGRSGRCGLARCGLARRGRGCIFHRSGGLARCRIGSLSIGSLRRPVVHYVDERFRRALLGRNRGRFCGWFGRRLCRGTLGTLLGRTLLSKSRLRRGRGSFHQAKGRANQEQTGSESFVQHGFPLLPNVESSLRRLETLCLLYEGAVASIPPPVLPAGRAEQLV